MAVGRSLCESQNVFRVFLRMFFLCFSSHHTLVYSDSDADSGYISKAASIVNLSLTLIRILFLMLPLLVLNLIAIRSMMSIRIIYNADSSISSDSDSPSDSDY